MTAPQREDDLAWELLEQYRDCLTAGQRTAAFVHLGVGDYQDVVRVVLHSVTAHQRTLSASAAAKVRAWIDCYDADPEFACLLSRATRSQ
ncbi:hypothetical protein BH10ACT9_BH10ACT9_45860 [soil metagenome]